jgi:serralysin
LVPAAPTVNQATTAASQTLTAPSGVNAQLSDPFGGSTLIGGGGDTFNVTAATTKLVVSAGTGPATVDAWVSYALPANADIMVLEAGHIVGTGNTQSDLIVAQGGHNVVQDGLGGDILVDSGAGGDTFWFMSAGNDDVIYGFQTSGANHDVLNLTNYHLDSMADVQSHMTQVGADVELALSATNTILIRNTTIAAFTLADVVLPVDYSRMHLTFDEEFNGLSLYDANSGQGEFKTSYITGVQGEAGATTVSSRSLPATGEKELYVDPSYAGAGTTPLGLDPFRSTTVS